MIQSSRSVRWEAGAPARVQQLELDLGVGARGRGPRPIKFVPAVLRELVDLSTLVELSGPERRKVYDLANLSPLHRAQVEDEVRRVMRRRYGRPA